MILVVDDDQSFLEQAKTSLAPSATRGVFFANRAKQALGLVQKMGTALSMVLIDLDLPGVSGFELISTMRAKHPDIPVIAISGVYRHTALESAKIFGADAVLSKPISNDWRTTLARVRASRGTHN